MNSQVASNPAAPRGAIGRAAHVVPASWLTWRRLLYYVVLAPLVIAWLLPVFSAVLIALRSLDDLVAYGPLSLPREIEWGNFSEAWNRGGLSRYMRNSFVIAVPAVAASLFLSSLAAFALARYRFRGNRALYLMFVAGMLLPYHILLLPVFGLSNALDLYNTLWVLIIVNAALQIAFCTFVLRNFMRTVPGSLLDAARIDGASEFRIYWQIMLPLSLPSMAALATLLFTWVYNDYLWPLVLIQDDNLKPVTVGLANLKGQYSAEWNVLFAGTLIAAIPTVLVFVFLQRYFVQGLTMGSSK